MLEAILIVVALHIGFLMGYWLRDIRIKIAELNTILNQKRDKPPVDEKKSTIVDPLDPIQEAKREFEQRQKELNPDYE